LTFIEIYDVQITQSKNLLPKYLSKELIESSYEIYIRFYSSLFASISTPLFDAGTSYIAKLIQNSTQSYVAIHKRNLEGVCNNYYCNRFNYSGE
jgi:hypothetical protein